MGLFNTEVDLGWILACCTASSGWVVGQFVQVLPNSKCATPKISGKIERNMLGGA